MDRIDCLVVGAGVVGLACARALAQAGLEVVITERENLIGSGVSARNSEVIHAGLYNPPGFCALKGVAVDELDGLLELARAEAGERARQTPARPGPSRNAADFDRPRHPGPAGGGPGRRPAR